MLKHHDFQILHSQKHEESQRTVATRTTSLLVILPNFNESDIMEKEAKQVSLYVCFDVEKPESQVKR